MFKNIHTNFHKGWSINGFANYVETESHFATSGPYPLLGVGAKTNSEYTFGAPSKPLNFRSIKKHAGQLRNKISEMKKNSYSYTLN